MGDLSPHFSRWEFRCGDGCGLSQPDANLVMALERLRGIVRRPLPIVSGHRCVRWNRKVGGIPASMHLVGRAADIPGGYALPVQVRDAGFSGCGMRHGRVIHVDVQSGRSFHIFDD